MTEDNNMPEIGPKDELIDAIAELDDEGDRVIELKDEDDEDEIVYSADHNSQLVVGATEEVLDAGFVIDEDSPEGIFDYDDGMDAGDEE